MKIRNCAPDCLKQRFDYIFVNTCTGMSLNSQKQLSLREKPFLIKSSKDYDSLNWNIANSIWTHPLRQINSCLWCLLSDCKHSIWFLNEWTLIIKTKFPNNNQLRAPELNTGTCMYFHYSIIYIHLFSQPCLKNLTRSSI